MMVMLYPVIWWGWAPPMEVIQFTEDPLGSLGVFIIPSLILGTYLSAATMRITRTMMLEVLRQDYIRTAWSKGLRERAVVVRHAIKNALIPIVTLVGLRPHRGTANGLFLRQDVAGEVTRHDQRDHHRARDPGGYPGRCPGPVWIH